MAKNLSCSEKTKVKMCDALKKLIVTNTFEKITVCDITDECGIHRQTFYYHFQDKYELLDWLFYYELLKPFMEGFTFENMFEKLFDALSTIYNEKEFYKCALQTDSCLLNKYVSEMAKKNFSAVVQEISDKNGVSLDHNDNLMLAEFIGFGITGIIIDWVNNGFDTTPDDMKMRIQYILSSCKALIS